VSNKHCYLEPMNLSVTILLYSDRNILNVIFTHSQCLYIIHKLGEWICNEVWKECKKIWFCETTEQMAYGPLSEGDSSYMKLTNWHKLLHPIRNWCLLNGSWQHIGSTNLMVIMFIIYIVVTTYPQQGNFKLFLFFYFIFCGIIKYT
jgi:hypothetical protein